MGKAGGAGSAEHTAHQTAAGPSAQHHDGAEQNRVTQPWKTQRAIYKETAGRTPRKKQRAHPRAAIYSRNS